MSKFEMKHLMLYVLSLLFCFSNQLTAQTCPGTSNLNKTFNTNATQVGSQWSPVTGAIGYGLRIDYNYGPGIIQTGPATSSVNPVPSGTFRVDISVTSICGKMYLGGKTETTGIFIAQADINLDEPLCDDMLTYPLTELHELVNLGLGPDGVYTTQQILNMFCNTGQRLPNLIPTTISPNPFTEGTSINFQLTEQANVSIQVFSSNGQQYQIDFKDQTLEAGIYNVPLNAYKLPIGVYYARLNINGEPSIYKFIKVE